MNLSPSNRRMPWIALALSFLSMGVGHIYCGRIAKGLVLYLVWFVIPALGLAAAAIPPNVVVLVLMLLLPALTIFGLYVYAAFDAFSTARGTSPDYIVQDYNRPSLYAWLIVVQLACPMAFMAGVRALVYEACYMPTASMSPTVLPGDRILINKLNVRGRFPERGKLVVFSNPTPDAPAGMFVKRVIAVAGDKVVVDGDAVEVNGRTLERERIPADAMRAFAGQEFGDAFFEFNVGQRYTIGLNGDSQAARSERFEVIVPERCVFVLGDNRGISHDSRHFGAVPIGDVIGYPDYIYWPAATWSRFGRL